MKRFAFILTAVLMSTVVTAHAGGIKMGAPLAPVTIENKGLLVPEYDVKKGKMVFRDNSEIKYRKWSSSELTGKIRTIYHLAARNGVDEINQPFIDALIEAELPEKKPDSPYKTTTILNTDDALWGTAGIASGRFCDSQKEFPYAYYINDENGIAQKAWGLKRKETAVIILDTKGNVIYFKEGKLSPEEIKTAVSLIKDKLSEM